MRRGLRFLAVSVPILISLAINIVLAALSKKAANIEMRPSQIHDLAATLYDRVMAPVGRRKIDPEKVKS
ncbi:MAG: hypothetical protein WCD56_21315 [Pseudolabrys sp.]